jgi:hypothetical protein
MEAISDQTHFRSRSALGCYGFNSHRTSSRTVVGTSLSARFETLPTSKPFVRAVALQSPSSLGDCWSECAHTKRPEVSGVFATRVRSPTQLSSASDLRCVFDGALLLASFAHQQSFSSWRSWSRFACELVRTSASKLGLS